MPFYRNLPLGRHGGGQIQAGMRLSLRVILGIPPRLPRDTSAKFPCRRPGAKVVRHAKYVVFTLKYFDISRFYRR